MKSSRLILIKHSQSIQFINSGKLVASNDNCSLAHIAGFEG